MAGVNKVISGEKLPDALFIDWQRRVDFAPRGSGGLRSGLVWRETVTTIAMVLLTASVFEAEVGEPGQREIFTPGQTIVSSEKIQD